MTLLAYLLLDVKFPVSAAGGECVHQALVRVPGLVNVPTLGVLDQHLPGLDVVRVLRQLHLGGVHPVWMDHGHGEYCG